MRTLAEIMRDDTDGTIRKVVEVARKHNGRYYLVRRYRRDPFAPKSALDYVYDACETLVHQGKARWLPEGDSHASGPGPGIILRDDGSDLASAASAKREE